jgi:heat shock protein HspQ
MVSQEILMAHQSQAMAHFELWCVKKFCSCSWCQIPEPKLTLSMQPWYHICCCQTVSYHTYGTNDWYYGVLRDFDGPSVPGHGTFWAGMCQKVQLTWCQPWAKTHQENWDLSKSSTQPKLTLFAAMTPYLLLPNSFISHLWDQWLVLWCPKRFWWPIRAKPWLILSCDVSKSFVHVHGVKYLSQNSHCLQPWHHICCCQTVSYHIYGTNDWCYGVPRDFDGPSDQAMAHFELWCVKKFSSCSWCQIPEPNSHCLQPWYHICCCQTVAYHTYGTNDWCYGVPRDFDGPSVPGHGTFWAGMCQKVQFMVMVSNTWAKTHIVCSHDTISVAAKK